jgi:hypothetical protein
MSLPKRLKPKVVVREQSQFHSERSAGVPLNLIVIHSTESHNRPGVSDLAAIGSWFNNPAAQASAHVCTDADGNSARFVADRAKAWHCAGYNSASLGVEQIGYAAQGWTKWRKNNLELWETARWIAAWSLKHDIPIRRGKVSGGVVTRSGVVKHSDLGSIGGNHNDPGKYPLTLVLHRARRIKRARKRRMRGK